MEPGQRQMSKIICNVKVKNGRKAKDTINVVKTFKSMLKFELEYHQRTVPICERKMKD